VLNDLTNLFEQYTDVAILVAEGQLSLFSNHPPVGYCRSDESDSGNYTVTAVVSHDFIDFTNDKGSYLSSAGVKPGVKWCLCAARCTEATEAAKAGELKKEDVPKFTWTLLTSVCWRS
jgi:uncharacterized protein (DUF2237 family)